MSPGFKTSLAALAVAGLMFAPVVGTGIAYAAETSTEEATTQVVNPSSDAEAAKAKAEKEAKEAAEKAAAEAAQKKADEEAAAAKAEAEKKAQEEADAKKAADEAAQEAEPAPSADPSTPAPEPTESASDAPAPKAKVAANTVSYDPVGTYFTHSGEEVCPAGPVHIAVKSGAPELEFSFPTSDGGTTTEQIQGGDEFDIDLVNGEITVTASVRFDDGNTTTFTVKCPAQDPDTDGDGVPDKDDAFPNDPNESADADKDGVGDNADKCPGTKADADVNTDGCSAEQLGDKPDATFPQDPKYNNVSFWNDYFGDGAVCVKFEPVSTPFTVPTNPSGYSWFSAIVKAGASDAANELYNGVKPGDKLVHSSGKSISHVILCKRAVTVKKQYAVVIWQVNDYPTNSMWPQTLVDSVTGLDAPNLGYFDALLKGKCVKYQVDVYHYDVKDGSKAKVDKLIATGHLYGSNNPPEPLISGGEGTAWKFYSNNDCTTYYDAPTIQVWDQKCVVGDQGVGQYTDGGFAVTAADKVSVVVTDSDDKVVTDPSHVKPGVYTVSASAPKGGAWNTLPDGWSYVGESKTVIKTVVTVNAAKDCSVQKPPPIIVPKSDSKSDCYGFYTRSWNEVKYPVWKDEAWTFDGVEPVIENDTGFVFDRALTNDEWWKLGCYPEQPPNLVVPMQDTKSDCYAHYLRTWDLVTTYTWVWAEGTENGRGSWVAQEPVVQNDTGWVLQSVLTNDEWWAMGCYPEQPPVLVDHQFDTKATCDGRYKSTWDLVSTPVWTWFEGEEWSPENRGEWVFQQPVVENFKDWFWTGKLSSTEKKELGCTSGPLNGISPDVPWGPIGALAGLAILAAGGAWLTSRRPYKGTQG